MKIIYMRPDISDIPGIQKMLAETFDDTFKNNNIVSIFEIEDEINEKIDKIKKDIVDHDGRFHFLIAKDGNVVVGICAFFPVSEIIREHIGGISDAELEVGCAYVSPKYQGLGIGKMLSSLIREELIKLRRTSYYLCSGFETSQRYWRKELGEPIFAIKDIWGSGKHELIWKVKIQ